MIMTLQKETDYLMGILQVLRKAVNTLESHRKMATLKRLQGTWPQPNTYEKYVKS